MAGVLAAVVAAANAVSVVIDLTAGDVQTTGARVFAAIRIILVVTFTVQALYELRSRVAVDGDGVHHQQLGRARNYRWDETAEVRPGRTVWGDPFVELVRHDGEPVPLFKSAGHLDVLRRWHAAVSGRAQA